MTDPSRLIEGDVGFEAEVLQAWKRRQPSDAARQRALVATGVAGLSFAAASTTVGAVASGSTAGTVGKVSASVAPKAALSAASLLKLIGACLGSFVAAGVVVYEMRAPRPVGAEVPSSVERQGPEAARDVSVDERAPSSTPPITRAPAGDRAGDHAAESTSWTSPMSATPGVTDERSIAARSTPRAVSSYGGSKSSGGGVSPVTSADPTAAPSLAGPSTLEAEVSAIDESRRALAAGEGARAIQLAEAYDARYPAGSLHEESAAIRIEALVRVGNVQAARALAARFLGAHPASPYARGVRELFPGENPPLHD